MADNRTDAQRAIDATALITGAYIGLISAVTDADAGTVTELTGGSYARVDISESFPTPDGGELANDEVIEFAEATGDWTEATHAGIWSAATEGTLRAVVALATARTVLTGETARFPVGSIVINPEA